MPLPPDAAERRESLDVSRSFLVTAPAGAGKTELLIQRYFALLAVVNEPEEILAVTFTNKAAGEMRHRILSALETADTTEMPEEGHAQTTWKLASAVLERDSELNWRLLHNPTRLNIKTIDAFCASLARRAPIMGQIGGGMQIADDVNGMYRGAVRNILATIEEDRPYSAALEKLLVHLDNRFDIAEDLLTSMLGRRDQWLPVVMEARRHNNLREALESNLQKVRSDFLTVIAGSLKPFEADIVRCAKMAATYLTDESPCLGVREIAEQNALPAADSHLWPAVTAWFYTKSGEPRKQGVADTGHPNQKAASSKEGVQEIKESKAAFAALLKTLSTDEKASVALSSLQSLPPAAYQENEWTILSSLLDLLPWLASELLLQFKKDGTVDHVEVTAAAARVLGDDDSPTDLALVLDASIKHVMFDEFQDTNDVQIRLLDAITRGWEVNDGRTVFLVGDPAQSIYRFRGSNVGLFVDAERRGINNVALERLALTANFRSHPGVVNWVNRAFGPAFPDFDQANLGAVRYADAIAASDGDPSESRVTIECYDAADGGHEAEAAGVAAKIKALQTEKPDETVAILVRARAHLTDVLDALKRVDVDTQAVDIEPLANRLEIRDLVSLTRAICHLGDDIAWMSLLRSPMIGLDRNIMAAMFHDRGYKTVWEIISRSTPKGRHAEPRYSSTLDRLKAPVAELKMTLLAREKMPLYTVVKGAWLALNGPATLTDDESLKNVDAFFELLRRFTLQNFDAAALQTAVEKLYSKPHSASENPVQIMTIHKSKGLEFDHVFVLGLDRIQKSDGAPLLSWDHYEGVMGDQYQLLATKAQVGNSAGELQRFLLNQEKQRANFEKTRLLYVAATRAAKTLTISSVVKIDEDTCAIATPTPATLLSLIWPSISADAVVAHASPLPAAPAEPIPDEFFDAAENIALPFISAVESTQSPDRQRWFDALLWKFKGGVYADSNASRFVPSFSYDQAVEAVMKRALQTIATGGLRSDAESLAAQTETFQIQLEAEGVPRFVAHQYATKATASLCNVVATEAWQDLLNNADWCRSGYRLAGRSRDTGSTTIDIAVTRDWNAFAIKIVFLADLAGKDDEAIALAIAEARDEVRQQATLLENDRNLDAQGFVYVVGPDALFAAEGNRVAFPRCENSPRLSSLNAVAAGMSSPSIEK